MLTSSTHLREIPGVAALSAAKFIAEVAGIGRFKSKNAFARHNGTAPLPVWSGNRERHRLSRSGNRQLNAAIHRIALTQARYHPDAIAFIERRTAAGDSGKGAVRALKRRLSDVVFRAMVADLESKQARRGQLEPHLWPLDIGERGTPQPHDHRDARHSGLLLRLSLALAARLEREHERPAPRLFPERHGPSRALSRAPARRRERTQRATSTRARRPHSDRAIYLATNFIESVRVATMTGNHPGEKCSVFRRRRHCFGDAESVAAEPGTSLSRVGLSARHANARFGRASSATWAHPWRVSMARRVRAAGSATLSAGEGSWWT